MDTRVRKRKPRFFLSLGAGILSVTLIAAAVAFNGWLNSDRIEMIETTEVAEVTEVPKAGIAVETNDLEAGESEGDPTEDRPLESESSDTEPEIAPEQTTETPKLPSFSVWRGFLKGLSYSFIEVKNATPYVYMPSERGDFEADLNNIVAGKEGNNIIVMANAGIFRNNTEPMGMTIQNGKIVSEHEGGSRGCWTLVIDEDGNVGYVDHSMSELTTDYIDARTGEVVTGKKIVSAVYAFIPFVLNGQVINEQYRDIYEAYRARQIFCVKQDSYMIITNTGEGKDGGGWDFNDMVQVAKYRECLSAFNLDGGGSTATAYRISLNNNFTISATTKRRDPTFIVFTADNLAPSGK